MLHLKYRPTSFRQVVGNETVIKSLQSIVSRGHSERPHAYMLVGNSGTGKTTLARILAKEFGVADGDMHEINSSDNRGIETARDIIKQAKLKPMYGDAKAYILDEFHKTTSDGQNGLLKVLEDTPPHCYFFIATTEPNKVIKAIHTRCSTYEVKSLDEDEITELLKRVTKAEGVDIPQQAYEMIATAAMGSPRAALVILDQVIDLDDADMLAAIDKVAARESKSIELCQALMARAPWKTVTKLIQEIEEEPESLRRMILGYFSTVALNKEDPNAILMLDCFSANYYDNGKAGLILSCYAALGK